MKRNSVVGIILCVAVVAGGVAFFSSREPKQQTDRVRVVASFYPLAYLAEQVGGSAVDVVNLTPAGAEPHDYELSPGDLVSLQEADIVIINGEHLEPWADKVLDGLPTSTHVLTMSDLLDQADRIEQDPHVWLDPLLFKKEAAIIRDALIARDPAHTDTYQIGYASLEAQLDAIDMAYREGLSSCTRRDIVVSHDAFRYLAKRYTIESVPIAGLSPEEEPSPRRLSEIAAFARDKGIRVIFFETLVSPRLAETIAREIGVETSVLNPIEGVSSEEREQGVTYLTLMQENLAHLQHAMVCETKPL